MINDKTPIGEIVTADFRTAELFKEAGIDFCCGGKITLDEACRQKGLNPDEFLESLNSIIKTPGRPGQNFLDWSPDFLCDYIVNTHHKYVKKALPELEFYTNKIASVHGEHHTELIEVANLFSSIKDELTQHLQKEEDVLFPAIKEALAGSSGELGAVISGEISRMGGEHEFAGEAMDKINHLTDGYKMPEDGCSTYQVCLQMLKQFEDDLHIHVHLENNILFNKALEL